MPEKSWSSVHEWPIWKKNMATICVMTPGYCNLRSAHQRMVYGPYLIQAPNYGTICRCILRMFSIWNDVNSNRCWYGNAHPILHQVNINPKFLCLQKWTIFHLCYFTWIVHHRNPVLGINLAWFDVDSYNATCILFENCNLYGIAQCICHTIAVA